MAVTIHANGKIVNSSGVNVAAEPMVDQWRIDDTTVNGTGIISSGWARCNDSTFVKIGTGMSQSSGILLFRKLGYILLK